MNQTVAEYTRQRGISTTPDSIRIAATRARATCIREGLLMGRAAPQDGPKRALPRTYPVIVLDRVFGRAS